MVLNSKQVSVNGMDGSSPFQELLKKNGRSLEIIPASNTRTRTSQQQKAPPLKCPRCNSTNTKFCYYNNYSRSQPRYICKACKRHWTEGGTLRDVPVRGNRKAKRLNTSSSSTSLSSGGSNINSQAAANTEQPRQFPHLSLSISRAQEMNSFFPDVLSCVLTQPSLQLPSSLVPIMSTDMEPVWSTNSRISVANDLTNTEPFSISACASFSMQLSAGFNVPHQILGTELSQMPQSSSRVVLDTTAPSFWSCWDDDITGLVAAPDH